MAVLLAIITGDPGAVGAALRCHGSFLVRLALDVIAIFLVRRVATGECEDQCRQEKTGQDNKLHFEIMRVKPRGRLFMRME